jgi:hypothetical protein
MLADYDADPAGALGRALRIVLDADASDWASLVDRAGFDPARADALRRGDVPATDALLRELNELRGLDPYPPRRWIGGGS